MANLNVNTSDTMGNQAVIDAMREEARALGIQNWHNMKPENLSEKIREKKAELAAAMGHADPTGQPGTPGEPGVKETDAPPVLPRVEEAEKPIAPKKKSIDEMTPDEIFEAARLEQAKEILRKAQEAENKRNQESELEKGKVNMTAKIDSQPKVMVRVPFQEGKPLSKTVIVNGYKVEIPVETDVMVPLCIAEALDDSMRAEYTNYKKFKKGESDFLSMKSVIYK